MPDLRDAGGPRPAAMALLDEYEGAAGISPDDYAPEPQIHSMAEAKYMLACTELRETALMAGGPWEARIAPALERLVRTAVRPAPGMVAWGLGFPYRHMPAGEPYVITTAMVLRALVRVRDLLSGGDRATCEELIAETTHWLLDGIGRADEKDGGFPFYSPRLPHVPVNVAAYWAGSLALALPVGHHRRAEASAAAERVLDRLIPGVGWRYEASSLRVDLLHTCYTGVGLLAALPERRSELEGVLVPALLQFAGTPWVDGFDAYEAEEVFDEGFRSASRTTRIVSDVALVGLVRRARAWSVGEALVLLGDLATSERMEAFCTAQARALAATVAAEYLPEPHFRHSMHLAHGLGVVVRTMRSQRRPVSS